VVTDDGCHLFTGASDGRGYGKVAVTVSGKLITVKTHVLSYLLHRGDIVGRYDVCHSCNVKNCVNPEHLYLGTRSENIQHAVRDNLRIRSVTDEQVSEVYLAYHSGEKVLSIGRKYGLCATQVHRIGRTLSFLWVKRPDISSLGLGG
jgi:hypothetical protein